MIEIKHIDPLQLENELHPSEQEGTEFLEGCLIDNLLFFCEDIGLWIIAKETYLNCWMSEYTLYTSTDCNEVFDFWYELVRQYDQCEEEGKEVYV